MELSPRKLRPLQWILAGVAVLFHAVGLVGIGMMHSDAIRRAAPYHMLLMAVLLFIAFFDQLRRFAGWAFGTAAVCLAAEWIGVHYGWLFGGYSYGNVLGIKWQGIPLIIGLNWAVVTAGAIAISERLSSSKWLIVLSAATLATAYDWILEPVAIKLGYWNWKGGGVPPYNYLCWWMLSALSARLWSHFGLRGNFFARSLAILQIIFFVLLRMLL